MDPIHLYLYALPIFLAAIGIEAAYYASVLKEGYDWKVMFSNLTVALGLLASQALAKGAKLAVYVAAYELRPFDIPLERWESWLALFLAVDFAYYCLHRASHEVRWMWAQHSVHHSAQQVTLSVAYRLGWTGFIAGPWLFLIPVCWIGFDPRAVVLMYAANLLYQFWLHTESVPKLGAFEWLFNTPAHHRIHHAVNPEYLDRNYGGVFIIFDRLFGTFAAERPGTAMKYGLVKQLDTLQPLRIVFHEWTALLRDLRSAKSLREAWGYLFGAPGWRPDGSGLTTAAIRATAQLDAAAGDARRVPSKAG